MNFVPVCASPLWIGSEEGCLVYKELVPISPEGSVLCDHASKKAERTSVFGDRLISTHANLRPHFARFHERCISSVTFTSAHLYFDVYILVGVVRVLANLSDFGLLGAQSFPKCETSVKL